MILTEKTFQFEPFLTAPSGSRTGIPTPSVERLCFPTFDTDPETGKPRSLHAFLYHPQHPPPPERRLLLIEAFYGGQNAFNPDYQVLTDAGIYVLSPSPRGSNGFGRHFATLNDGDLGGDEITDLTWAARSLSAKLSIPPHRIGLFGSSHGGYATLRALTLPHEQDRFEWGFGIAHAAFSDLHDLYENGKVREWLTTEAGPPGMASGFLHQRSPFFHIDRLQAPLLLLHGAQDQRVPLRNSEKFAEKAIQSGKPVTYIVLPEQGHYIKGLRNELEKYKAWLNFLNNIDPEIEK